MVGIQKTLSKNKLKAGSSSPAEPEELQPQGILPSTSNFNYESSIVIAPATTSLLVPATMHYRIGHGHGLNNDRNNNSNNRTEVQSPIIEDRKLRKLIKQVYDEKVAELAELRIHNNNPIIANMSIQQQRSLSPPPQGAAAAAETMEDVPTEEDFSAQVREAVKNILENAQPEEMQTEDSDTSQSLSSYKDPLSGQSSARSSNSSRRRHVTINQPLLLNKMVKTKAAASGKTSKSGGGGGSVRPKKKASVGSIRPKLQLRQSSATIAASNTVFKTSSITRSFAASTISSKYKQQIQRPASRTNLVNNQKGGVKLKKVKSKGKIASAVGSTSKVNLRKAKSVTNQRASGPIPLIIRPPVKSKSRSFLETQANSATFMSNLSLLGPSKKKPTGVVPSASNNKLGKSKSIDLLQKKQKSHKALKSSKSKSETAALGPSGKTSVTSGILVNSDQIGSSPQEAKVVHSSASLTALTAASSSNPNAISSSRTEETGTGTVTSIPAKLTKIAENDSNNSSNIVAASSNNINNNGVNNGIYKVSPPAPLTKNPTMLDVNVYLARIQNYFDALGYQHYGEPKLVVNTHASIRSLNETAKKILKAGEKIKCLHALVLAIHLTNCTPIIERFPINFKSKMKGREYKHVVLGIYMYGHYGALGISRDEGLQGKLVKFARLSDLLEDFRECYEKSGHEVLEIKVGGTITHDPHSLAAIPWKVGSIIDYTKENAKVTVQWEADQISKLLKVQMAQTCLRQVRQEVKVKSQDLDPAILLKNMKVQVKKLASKASTSTNTSTDASTSTSHLEDSNSTNINNSPEASTSSTTAETEKPKKEEILAHMFI